MFGKFRKYRFLVALTVFVGVVPVVFAQPPWGGHRCHDDSPMDDNLDRLETLKMWKLTERLNLTDEQAAKLFPLMHKYRLKKDSLRVRERDLLDQLRDAVSRNADSVEILEIIDAIATARAEECQVETDFYQQIRGILSARQQAEFVLFEVEFRRKMMDLIRQMHRGRHFPPEDNPWE